MLGAFVFSDSGFNSIFETEFSRQAADERINLGSAEAPLIV